MGYACMSDRNAVNQNRRTAAANDAQTILSATHALSERLTAMTFFFGAARSNLAKREHKAADQMIVRLLEQNERARRIAEELRKLVERRVL